MLPDGDLQLLIQLAADRERVVRGADFRYRTRPDGRCVDDRIDRLERARLVDLHRDGSVSASAPGRRLVRQLTEIDINNSRHGRRGSTSLLFLDQPREGR